MTRTKDYNQQQRAEIETLRDKIAANEVLSGYQVVDMKRTPHTYEYWKAGGSPRFGIRSARQIELYSFYVVKK